MKPRALELACLAIALLCSPRPAAADDPPQFVDLFNGKDLSGWVNVNTDKDTWTVRDGLLVCSGRPIGVMRTEKQYENFILHIEWRHMEPGGNSGVFAWSDGTVPEGKRLPRGLEIQMLDLDWVNLHKQKDGTLPPLAYVHGELQRASVEHGQAALTASGSTGTARDGWLGHPLSPAGEARFPGYAARSRGRTRHVSTADDRRTSSCTLENSSTRQANHVLGKPPTATVAMSSRKGARAGGEKGATWVQE